MYKLTFSPASPYVRKVLLSAYRVGIEDQMKLVTTESQDDNLLRSQNPLGKIPVLHLIPKKCLDNETAVFCS